LNFQFLERLEEGSELGNGAIRLFHIQLIRGKILEAYVDREIIEVKREMRKKRYL
jgi:hypothetical protein